MRVIAVDLSIFFLVCFTVLFITTEVDANNSSDTVGKVVSTRSKEQIQVNNNGSTTPLVSTIAETTNVSDKMMPIMSKDQTGSNNNVDTSLLVSPSVDVRNSSDPEGKVILTTSEEHLRGNNNVNTKIIVSPPVNTTNSSDTVKATEARCKEQIGTNNLNTTNLACVNHTMSLQNIGNEKKSVQSETKLMDKTNLTAYEDQNDRNIIDGPFATTEPPIPCSSPNETRTIQGTCTILYG